MPNYVMMSGSRGWSDASAIAAAFEQFAYSDTPTLLHGNARGADTIAARIAEEMGWYVEAVPANWTELGRFAGIARNIEMLDRNPGYVFIFWDGKSRGTQHVLLEVRKRGIPYSLIMMEME